MRKIEPLIPSGRKPYRRFMKSICNCKGKYIFGRASAHALAHAHPTMSHIPLVLMSYSSPPDDIIIIAAEEEERVTNNF